MVSKSKPKSKPKTKTKAATKKPRTKTPTVKIAVAVPVIDGSWPVCPETLRDSGKRLWDKGATLWARGEITVQDMEAWQMLCESFDELDHCYAVLVSHGEYQKSSQGGFQEHPALRRIRAVEAKILRYQKLFGLVPEARKKRPVVQQGVATRKR